MHALRSAVDGGNFSTTLLDGVTGSGKTEVYFEAVARTLERGQQAADHAAGNRAHRSVHAPLRGALRLPAGRMAFGAVRARARPRLARRRRPARRASSSARARRCSCRSRDLGLIVVDEEHDAGFKQDDRVHYQARDMAVVRGNLGGFPVDPRLGDAVDRDARQRAHRALSPRRAAGALLRRLAARRHRHRSARRPARQGQVAVAGAGRCGRPRRWRPGSSRCCSSTGAAMRR